MSQNRVIGRNGAIPWHLPEELRWFKRTTLGQAVLIGRRTFESIGRRPLPGRLNLVVTRGATIGMPGVLTIHDLEAFRPEDYAPHEVWVIGGAEIYLHLLPRCSELYLSVVACDVEGDVFFPAFEDAFSFAEVILRHENFEVRRYVQRPATLPARE